MKGVAKSKASAAKKKVVAKAKAKQAAVKGQDMKRKLLAHNTCVSCKQSTSDWERDLAPKQVFLKWKEERVKAGVVQFIGNECWYCYDTRRRFFEENILTLNELRATNDELDGNFDKYRRSKVRGTGEFVKEERVSAKSFV